MAEKGIIHFLDIGGGRQAERTLDLVREQGIRKPVVCVDERPRDPNSFFYRGLPYNDLPNFKYVQADAVDFLKSLEPESVRIINADFAMNAMGSDEKRQEFVRLALRALVPKGSLCISEDAQNANDVKEMLAQHEGFKVTSRQFKLGELLRSPSYSTRSRHRALTDEKFSFHDDWKRKNITELPHRFVVKRAPLPRRA